MGSSAQVKCLKNLWGLQCGLRTLSHNLSPVQRNVRCVFSAAGSESHELLATASSLTLDTLKRFGVRKPKLLANVKSMPVLSSGSPHEWQDIIQALGRCGLRPESIVSMVVKHPALLKYKADELINFYTNWYQCCLQNQLVKNIVIKYPQLLILPRDDVHNKFNHLKYITASYKLAAELIEMCPKIMLLPFSNLENVSDYISEEMVVRNASEYCKSVALGCTLLEVMTRHMFLVRCGKYKKPHLKHSEKMNSTNPTLMQIYNTSDEVFATEVAGLTFEEFVVFQTLFKEEMKNVEESDEESGDESDSDG